MANILAVDDEKAVLTLIKNILEMDHHVVTAVSDPEKIFDLQLGRFDLILLDVMMPNETVLHFAAGYVIKWTAQSFFSLQKQWKTM